MSPKKLPRINTNLPLLLATFVECMTFSCLEGNSAIEILIKKPLIELSNCYN